MFKSRKVRLASVTVAAILALSGCGTTAVSASSDAGSRGEVKKILFDYPYTALPVYSALVPKIKAAAKKAGVSVEFTNDDMDLAKQVTNLNAYVSSDVDAVVSFPADPTSLEGIAKDYVNSGKYWVSYAGDVNGQDATLQWSFEKSGRMLGEDAGTWAQKNLGGKGKVLIISETTVQVGRERTKGLIAGLKETAPDMTVVLDQEGVTPTDGLTITNAVLAKHPDVNMVLATVGDAAQGAYQALVASGRSETDAKTYVGGLDPNLFELQKMEAGSFFRGTTYFSLDDMATAVVNIPIALGEGKKNASINLPVKLVKHGDPQMAFYIQELGG
ncbi:MAG TPA: sugar ABC transporter substrate-binding protein [Pseudolysinimonas sp.]|nr:sugar ABC transporter substrate-binding protein [Pseudolysinimonas sp.]